MGRRRKGRAISGWVIIDKPAGITSTAVANKVRWAFDANKAGHAGTLDPAATGLLAVALGEATKTVPYVMDDLKAYEFVVNWGVETNTDDAEGKAVNTSDTRPEPDAIASALSAFIGDIEQVPPAFSAVKIDGERAYKRARDGEDITLAARPLFVENLRVIEHLSPDQTKFELICGKGGYVRAIARDLGRALGCLGHVDHLRRIWSGPFDLNHAVTFDQIEALAKKPEIDALMHPLVMGLAELPKVTIGIEAVGRLRNGNPVPVVTSEAELGEDAWAAHKGEPLAIGTYMAGHFHPSRVFVPAPNE